MVHRHEPEADALAPAYAGRLWTAPVPKNRMPATESPPQAVYRMIHAGELPAVRFGRSYRVPQSAVEEILQTGTTEVRVTGTEDQRG